MYDKDWERYRARYLAINKECYACGKPSTVVDHLIPHKGDKMLFELLDNHIPLCFSCHNYVTAKFDKFHTSGGPTTRLKTEWLNSRRIISETWTPKKVKVLQSYR